MAKINQAMADLLRYNAAIDGSLPRSRFNKNHSHLTTLDSAYLVPIMWDRVLPGDEKQIRYSGLARMATPVHPVADEAKLDVWAFYVPDRLWWNHAKEFYGENLDAAFNEDGMYEMPSLTPDQYLFNSYNETCSLKDYFGFPIWNRDFDSLENFKDELRCTAGLFRSYQLIWNEWFRNSSVQPALRLNTGDTVTSDEYDIITQIRKVCKYPDYFTTLLKTPQAGDDVLLPLGEWAPVVTTADRHGIGSVALDGRYFLTNPNETDWRDAESNPAALLLGVKPYSVTFPDNKIEIKGKTVALDPTNAPVTSGTESAEFYPNNLWADLTDATAATINNLRAAVTIQHLLERDAIAGKRYQNILQAHFGVFTPDATLQRPELLGLTSTPIGMRQVLQTSSTVSGSPQGNTAAFSLTSVTNEWICNKAFTEPGFIMVLAAIRPSRSYSQGLNPLLRKLDRYDHFWPVFDRLGNQPVNREELFLTASDFAADDPLDYVGKTFGYKEAWTEYKTMGNRVSGYMRPDHELSLASWNYSEFFGEAPILNSQFVEENPNLIDRTISVESSQDFNGAQFILDNYFEYSDTKSMSVHSQPGILYL